MFAMSDIIERIKGLRYVHVPQASQLFEEAIAEIERLRSLVRFQDGVIRSGDVACLTEAEREALEVACEDLRHVEEVAALRGLLERIPCALAGRE
jgi:hypothetical protein